MAAKWSRTFWSDLAERVGTTAIGALLGVLAGSASGAIPNDPAVWWSVIGVPTLTSLLKGLAANMASPESGPSLLSAPPAPVVEPTPEPVAVAAPLAAPAKKTVAKKTAAKRATTKKAVPKPPSGLS